MITIKSLRAALAVQREAAAKADLHPDVMSDPIVIIHESDEVDDDVRALLCQHDKAELGLWRIHERDLPPELAE